MKQYTNQSKKTHFLFPNLEHDLNPQSWPYLLIIVISYRLIHVTTQTIIQFYMDIPPGIPTSQNPKKTEK